MTTAHKRYSKTSATVASSMGALFIRVFFIGTFVYAWFLIAQSSENNAVLFDDDKFQSEKREHEDHLEAEKLIPVENTANLLHSIGLPPETPLPTYPPFHEDKFLHDPPYEGPVDTRRKPLITGLDDTSVPSAVNARQQYDMVTYKNNMKPILKQSFSENNIINFQVPIENKRLNNYEDLLNTQLNTSSSTYLREEYSFTTVPGNNETESNTTPSTSVSVFSNFRDKLLNIIRPKASDDQLNTENLTTDSKAVDFNAERQDQYSASHPVDNTMSKSVVDTNGPMSTQPWKENDNQSKNQEHFRFQTQSVSNEGDGHKLPQTNDEIKLSGNTLIFNKLFHDNNLKENIQPNNEDNINTQINKLKESIQSHSDDNVSIQSLQNQDVPQNIRQQPQINKEYRTDEMAGRQSSKNGMCPTGNIITVVGGGRLANCIWEYASLWSVSKFLPGNRTAYAQKYIMKYLTKIFDNLSMPVVEEIPEDCACCKNVSWTDSNIHTHSFIPLKEVHTRFENVPGHIILSTFIVLVEPVLATIENLKKEMVYKPSLVQSAQNVIKSKTDDFRQKNDVRGLTITYVGMHVRRTDNRYYLMGKYNMTALGPEFYLKAMTYFRERRPDLGRPIFLVVSDDIPWVRKNLLQNDVFIVNRGGIEHPEHDLVLLSLCDHSIIDYDIYGLWAAVYAGGVTVTVKTNMEVYQILGRKPNWHFVSINPREESEVS